MSTKPEAGQWWVMDDDPSEIVFVVGFTPEMECVIKWGDGDLSVDDMTDFHHEPRCTGWDWVVPEPQPAEDPDEWVIQDQVPPRKDVDQISWGGGDWHSDWHKAWQFGNMMHGDYPRFGGRLNVRCRRRDLPKVEQAEKTTMIQVNPGEGYRWLEDHEIVQPDDEVFNPAVTPCWVKPLTRAGSTVKAFSNDDYPVRRKVEQPEQWPKYWETDGTAENVAFIKQVSEERFYFVCFDGSEELQLVKGFRPDRTRKQLTEAEAMALLKKPEPQPQKTRVRLWATPEGRPYFAPFQASKRDDEICVDYEGFYVEGGQS